MAAVEIKEKGQGKDSPSTKAVMVEALAKADNQCEQSGVWDRGKEQDCSPRGWLLPRCPAAAVLGWAVQHYSSTTGRSPVSCPFQPQSSLHWGGEAAVWRQVL